MCQNAETPRLGYAFTSADTATDATSSAAASAGSASRSSGRSATATHPASPVAERMSIWPHRIAGCSGYGVAKTMSPRRTIAAAASATVGTIEAVRLPRASEPACDDIVRKSRGARDHPVGDATNRRRRVASDACRSS